MDKINIFIILIVFMLFGSSCSYKKIEQFTFPDKYKSNVTYKMINCTEPCQYYSNDCGEDYGICVVEEDDGDVIRRVERYCLKKSEINETCDIIGKNDGICSPNTESKPNPHKYDRDVTYKMINCTEPCEYYNEDGEEYATCVVEEDDGDEIKRYCLKKSEIKETCDLSNFIEKEPEICSNNTASKSIPKTLCFKKPCDPSNDLCVKGTKCVKRPHSEVDDGSEDGLKSSHICYKTTGLKYLDYCNDKYTCAKGYKCVNLVDKKGKNGFTQCFKKEDNENSPCHPDKGINCKKDFVCTKLDGGSFWCEKSKKNNKCSKLINFLNKNSQYKLCETKECKNDDLGELYEYDPKIENYLKQKEVWDDSCNEKKYFAEDKMFEIVTKGWSVPNYQYQNLNDDQKYELKKIYNLLKEAEQGKGKNTYDKQIKKLIKKFGLDTNTHTELNNLSNIDLEQRFAKYKQTEIAPAGNYSPVTCTNNSDCTFPNRVKAGFCYYGKCRKFKSGFCDNDDECRIGFCRQDPKRPKHNKFCMCSNNNNCDTGDICKNRFCTIDIFNEKGKSSQVTPVDMNPHDNEKSESSQVTSVDMNPHDNEKGESSQVTPVDTPNPCITELDDIVKELSPAFKLCKNKECESDDLGELYVYNGPKFKTVCSEKKYFAEDEAGVANTDAFKLLSYDQYRELSRELKLKFKKLYDSHFKGKKKSINDPDYRKKSKTIN